MQQKNCNILHFPELGSTNTYAKKLLRDSHPEEFTAISTDFQTNGKGQEANVWESETGQNVLASIILYPDFLDIARQFTISMAVSVGIIEFLNTVVPEYDFKIKWPNDIYAGNKKLGGILISNEVMGNRFRHVVAGIGINVNQESFSADLPNPVSLFSLTGKTYPLQEMTSRLCNCVKGKYMQLREGAFAQIEKEYLDHLLGLGEKRPYIYKGKHIVASITGVNDYGQLLLETADGEKSCDLKEIQYLF